MGNWCYEVPAGGLSPGLTPEEVGGRQLLEEVGETSPGLRSVSRSYTSNGISNETTYVYLATGVELEETHREPIELSGACITSPARACRYASSTNASNARGMARASIAMRGASPRTRRALDVSRPVG